MTGRRSTAVAHAATLAGLLALATLSLYLSKINLGGGQTAVALGIAAAKGALVALVFMGLARARGSVIAAILTAVVLIAIMILLVAMDVATRPVSALPAHASSAARSDDPSPPPLHSAR